jgi:ADP-heptose:LPS heptosyltransferase
MNLPLTEAPRKVVVFLLSGLGDTLMFTPALRLLKLAWPDTEFTAVTMKLSEHDAVATNPDFKEVRMWSFLKEGMISNLGFANKLRSESFDLSIVPCPGNRVHYNVLSWLVGARQRVAFRYVFQSKRNFDFLNHVLIAHEDHVHNAEHNLRLAEALTGKKRGEVLGWDSKLTLNTIPEDRSAADRWMKQEGMEGKKYVGLHVSSSRAKKMDRKCWPKEYFFDLIEKFEQKDSSLGFLLFCGDEDLPESEWLVKRLGSRVRIARQLPVRVAADIIRRCSCFISNDSGMMHVAVAVGTPTVAIFGPTNPKRSGPWGGKAEVVRTGIECSPCFYHTSHDLTCPAGLDFACLKELSVEVVYAAAERLLCPS